jgi:hypothetical protein
LRRRYPSEECESECCSHLSYPAAEHVLKSQGLVWLPISPWHPCAE